MRRAGHQPRAAGRRRTVCLRSTTLASVNDNVAGAGETSADRVPARFSMMRIEDRRSPYLALNPPAVELEALDRLRVESARQAEEAIRVVDLDAVHHREVLIGSAAAHAQDGCRSRSPRRRPAASAARGRCSLRRPRRCGPRAATRRSSTALRSASPGPRCTGTVSLERRNLQLERDRHLDVSRSRGGPSPARRRSPSAVAVTEYRPGGSIGIVKRPSASEMVCR